MVNMLTTGGTQTCDVRGRRASDIRREATDARTPRTTSVSTR